MRGIGSRCPSTPSSTALRRRSGCRRRWRSGPSPTARSKRWTRCRTDMRCGTIAWIRRHRSARWPRARGPTGCALCPRAVASGALPSRSGATGRVSIPARSGARRGSWSSTPPGWDATRTRGWRTSRRRSVPRSRHRGSSSFPKGRSPAADRRTRLSRWRPPASGSASGSPRPSPRTAGSPTGSLGTSPRCGASPPAGRRPPGAPLPEDVRGALALHRLRAITGDSAFFAGLARFTADHMHGSATRADFVRSMSAVAGRDLDRDLRQAFDRAK